jgi:hypothetical protein
MGHPVTDMVNAEDGHDGHHQAAKAWPSPSR